MVAFADMVDEYVVTFSNLGVMRQLLLYYYSNSLLRHDMIKFQSNLTNCMVIQFSNIGTMTNVLKKFQKLNNLKRSISMIQGLLK